MTYKPDKLAFYSKSKDVSSGNGAQEYVNYTHNYKELNEIKDWRKILSNFHVYSFKYDDYTYNSIEHVFQAMKISLADPEKAFYFTIESQHKIGLGDGALAQKNRKLVKLNDNQLAQWDSIKLNVMDKAARCKYTVCVEARNVLMATKNAQLWHIVTRSFPMRFIHLETIRNELRDS